MATSHLKAKAQRQAKWVKSRAAESKYNSQLRAVAKQVGVIVKGFSKNGTVTDMAALTKALKSYAELIGPWAESVANMMLRDVEARDKAMWRRNSKEMGKQLSRVVHGLDQTPVGAILSDLQDEQVKLIKSLPLEAAERVHELSVTGLVESTRASEIARQILATGEVTEARARLIARTEVARASSNLVQARATFAGSEGYFWRTSGDSDVRDSHRRMEGKYVRWSEPPTLDNLKGHAGTLPNCRCFAEPHFPDD